MEKHDSKYYREPEDITHHETCWCVENASALQQGAVEKKVFVPFRKCRHPVQLLFGTFLLLLGKFQGC